MTKKTNLNPNTFLTSLNKFLDEYLVKKAPSLPQQVKEGIVKYGPYLILLSLFFTIPSLFALFGFNRLGFRYISRFNLGLNYTASIIIMLIGIILEVVALPGLFKKQASAWNLVYYSVLVNSLHSLLFSGFFGFILSTVLSLYILFQIKSQYK